METAIYKAKDLIERGEDFVIARVVNSQGAAPRKTGAWLLMEKNGACYGTVGGGLLEAKVINTAQEVFGSKTSETLSFRLNREDQDGLDMRCGGDVDVSVEYIRASDAGSFLDEFKVKSRAFIFGAGHVGLALDPVLRHIGFETIVIDDRVEFANTERFPESEIKVVQNFASALDNIITDKDSYIVIVTRGHAGDYDVLKQSLKIPNAYIGMIGSKKKVAELFGILLEEGFSQEQIGKVYSPIGLQIHSETPEEIAVSIAAEMINVRAGHGK